MQQTSITVRSPNATPMLIPTNSSLQTESDHHQIVVVHNLC
jgi:hypothetical protein